MLRAIITGGQTGVDQAAWRAARMAGLDTGGFMPLGFKTEAGPRPDFEALYGARQWWTDQYQDRTPANVLIADASLLLGNRESPGSKLLLKVEEVAARNNLTGKRPWPMVVTRHDMDGEEAVGRVAAWIRGNQIARLNVAGNRESSSPNIGAAAESFLAVVFKIARGDLSP
jgi:hypothetical protein